MSERWLPAGIQYPSQAYELLSEQVMHLCGGGEWKVVMFVARRTVGFGKQFDRISINQICRGIRTRDGKCIDHGTGLSRRAAVNTLRSLDEKNLVVVGKEYHKPSSIGLNWPFITALGLSQNCTNAESAPGWCNNCTPSSAKTAPTSISTTSSNNKHADLQATNHKNRNSQPVRMATHGIDLAAYEQMDPIDRPRPQRRNWGSNIVNELRCAIESWCDRTANKIALDDDMLRRILDAGASTPDGTIKFFSSWNPKENGRPWKADSAWGVYTSVHRHFNQQHATVTSVPTPAATDARFERLSEFMELPDAAGQW